MKLERICGCNGDGFSSLISLMTGCFVTKTSITECAADASHPIHALQYEFIVRTPLRDKGEFGGERRREEDDKLHGSSEKGGRCAISLCRTS